MGLYDNVLAQARQAEAMAAIDVPAEQATQYGAALGMARAKQGVNQMFGIEEPAVIAAKAAESQQQLLLQIRDKYQSATTRDDFTKAMNELMANGFPAEAQLMQEHIKNMPSNNPEKYSTGISLSLANLQKNPAYVNATFEKQQAMIKELSDNFGSNKTFTQNGIVYDYATKKPLIEGSKPNVDTFIQGGVVYNALTLKPMLKGSEEDRETFMQDGITYYVDTKLPVILGSEPERKSKLVNGTWRYVDTQQKVFTSVNAPADAEDQAADIYANALNFNPVNQNEIAPVLTNEKKIALARELIVAKLADTKIFSDLMASIDKDSVNAIQQENLLVKAVERLSVNYNDAGIGEMDNILTPIENLLNEYVPHLRQNGEFVYDRAGNAMRDYSEGIPGWSFINRYERYVGNDATTSAAKDFSEKAQRLINTIIKERSGSAVSIQEAERLTAEYETGFRTSQSFANWVGQVRNLVEQNRMEVVSGYAPEVQYRYFSQMGIYPTLTDPDVQLKALPIGAKWKDESGQVYIKNKNDD